MLLTWNLQHKLWASLSPSFDPCLCSAILDIGFLVSSPSFCLLDYCAPLYGFPGDLLAPSLLSFLLTIHPQMFLFSLLAMFILEFPDVSDCLPLISTKHILLNPYLGVPCPHFLDFFLFFFYFFFLFSVSLRLRQMVNGGAYLTYQKNAWSQVLNNYLLQNYPGRCTSPLP